MRPTSSYSSREVLSPSPPPPPKHRLRKPRKTSSYTQESDQEPASQSSASYSEYNTQHSVEEEDNTNINVAEDETNDIVSNSAATFTSSSSSSPSLLRPAPSAYINIAPLPIFRGSPSECPLTHLSRYRRVCRANNASTPSMILQIFPVTLEDQAALWYDLNVQPRARSMRWEHVESAFLKAFLTPQFVDRARGDLMALKQAEGESVSMFYLRMQWLLKKWPDHGLPDALLRGVFVDGLKEDFQDWVVLQRPETLEEAVKLATNWEQVQSLRAKRNKKVVVVGRCGFCDGEGHEEGECEVRRRMRELWLSKRREEGGLLVGGSGETGGESRKRRDGVVGMERVLSLGRRSQCQCWKHQCWKNLERSNTSVGNEKNENASNDQC